MTHEHIKQELEKFVEKGANLEHERWSGWHRYSRLMATPANIERWDRQAGTPYIALSEGEKESDRKEVRSYLPLIHQILSSERQRIKQEILNRSAKIRKDALSELLKLLE